MTPEQKVAYLISQCACAIIEALAIRANQEPGSGLTSDADDIRSLIDKYGIHHNAVVSLFQD